MVLIELHGPGCEHINSEEAQGHFAKYVIDHLLRELLSMDTCDIGLVFSPNSKVYLPDAEDFLVKVYLDNTAYPTEKMATVIAGCCNAAFHCDRCAKEMRTLCMIRSALGSTLTASTAEITQAIH